VLPVKAAGAAAPRFPSRALLTSEVTLSKEPVWLHVDRYAKDIEFGDSKGRRMVPTVSIRTEAGIPPVLPPVRALGNPPPARGEVPSRHFTSFGALLRHASELSFARHGETGSRAQLECVLGDLLPEARSKLAIVMMAGRGGLGIGSAHAGMSAAARSALGISRLESAGDELGEYLARGHAIACATQFDLEAPLDRWSVSESSELEERAWLRFGKQLAISSPENWECLGAGGGCGERLARLYLRVGKAVWWSFGAVLDRPSREMVRKDGWSRSGQHSKLGSLQSVVVQRWEPERHALQRALRAIRARVGEQLDT
jgi:hypothetical protein